MVQCDWSFLYCVAFVKFDRIALIRGETEGGIIGVGWLFVHLLFTHCMHRMVQRRYLQQLVSD